MGKCMKVIDQCMQSDKSGFYIALEIQSNAVHLGLFDFDEMHMSICQNSQPT